MNNIMSFLINYGFDRGISTVLTDKLPTDFPSSSSLKKQAVLINMNWPSKNEIPFILAHELGHLLNGDNGVNYYQSGNVHSKTEFEANKTAISLLVDYCQANDIEFDNPIQFCERFGIPTEYEYIVSFLTRPNTDDVKS